MRLFYIYNKILHHAAHSGYDQLPKYIPSNVLSPDITQFLMQLLRSVPEKRLTKWLLPETGGWYKREFLAQEIQVASGMALRTPFRKDVYHYLYGEDAFRWGAPKPFKCRNKIVVTFHQPPDIFKDVIRDATFINRADAIVVCGSNQVDFFEKLSGEKNVYFVPHGIDTDFFSPTADVTDGPFSTISVGWWLRDVDMIRTIASTAKKLGKDIFFNIVTFPQYFDFYRGLSNVRLYTGISDEALRSIYQRSDALLLPLKDSTANNAILEAMACGKPVLSTDVGGVRDYVNDQFGYLAKPGDDKFLLDALIELSTDEDKKRQMGKAARLKAMEFDWGKVAEHMTRVYRRI